MPATRWVKGSRGPSEHLRFSDPETGATVHRLTGHHSISHPTYFLQCSFTVDQSRVLFTGYRSGSAQLFDVGFPDGGIRQLTGGDPVHPFSALIAPDGTVLFVRGGSIWRLDPESLDETLVADSRGQLGECSLDSSGS